MPLWKKKGNSDEEMQNWYQDRYVSVSIQRNFLLLFSLFAAAALLVCLIIIKQLQEGKASDPYLIEYDKKTGLMTIVESQSKKEYTAQQAVKESMVMQYIYHREAPKLSTIEDDMNYVRVTTASKIYQDYVTDVAKNVRELKAAGTNPKYELTIKSLQYTAAQRMQIVLTKSIIVDDKEIDSTDYRITITFGFSDIEMPIDDLRLNPLGFQVMYYRAAPIKTFKSQIMNNENNENTNKNDNNNNNDVNNKQNAQ